MKILWLEDLAILFGTWLPGKPWFPAVRFREPTPGIATARFLQRNLYGGGGYPGGRDVCHGVNLNFYIPTPPKSWDFPKFL